MQPHGVVVEEASLTSWGAAVVAERQASAYVAPGGDPGAPRVFDHPGLRVSAASPEHLLAMKVIAARRRDAEDIMFLVKHLTLATVERRCGFVPRSSPTRRYPSGRGWSWGDVFGDR